ncbi:ribonuclease H-like protein, partial [Lactarius deliciosus]
ITIYTDGACFNNGKANARCGSGIWVNPEDPRNEAMRVPGPKQSNQIGEVAAIIAAINKIPNFWPILIKTDSKYTIDGLTTHLGKWEDAGWIGIENAALFKKAAYLLKRRTATTSFQWVKGHNGDVGNEESDKLARRGAEKDTPDDLPLDIPTEYDLQGAKLASLTQATAYKGIRERHLPQPRHTTAKNIELAKTAILRFNKIPETSGSIWKNIRKRSIRPKIQQYIFKAMHGTFMLGEFWGNIPEHEHRKWCATCHKVETMDHILTKCTAEPVRLIWEMARETWPHPQDNWPQINFGTILGCGSLATTAPENQAQQDRAERNRTNLSGPNRLLHILVSESAYLIWVLRCERVIKLKIHSAQEIKNRWLKAINERLTNDKITATKIKRSNAMVQSVDSTWKAALSREWELPPNWIIHSEVLVGMRARSVRVLDDHVH